MNEVKQKIIKYEQRKAVSVNVDKQSAIHMQIRGFPVMLIFALAITEMLISAKAAEKQY